MVENMEVINQERKETFDFLENNWVEMEMVPINTHSLVEASERCKNRLEKCLYKHKKKIQKLNK